MYFKKKSTSNYSTSLGENIRRIDRNDMSIPESPCDDADALLPSNPRVSDETVTERTLWSNDKRRGVISKMLLLIAAIFLGVLALIIIFLLAVFPRHGPNQSISTEGPNETSMTAIGMGDDISLNQHSPDAGSVGGTNDDHGENDPSGAQ
jgi:hypothetical protein